jgi:hypothetical protein
MPATANVILTDGTKHITVIMIATATSSIALAVLVGVFANKGTHPSSRMAQCSMGFVVAIVWIMAIADEVVNVLQVRVHDPGQAMELDHADLRVPPDVRTYFWPVECDYRVDDFCGG